MVVLGVNSVFHDPSAALVVDGELVAAAEEERFSRRKHGRREPNAFSAWEMPREAMRWCLDHFGIAPAEVDILATSYDPECAPGVNGRSAGWSGDPWEDLRTMYATRAPWLAASILPGLDPAKVVPVPHHVAHAASAYLAAPFDSCAVVTADGRGECTSGLIGHATGGRLEVLAEQPMPHSLGILYEDLTEYLGFARSSDEYKIMALAAYGAPSFADPLRAAIEVRADGTYMIGPIDFSEFVGRPAGSQTRTHADLACSVQTVLEETLLEIAWAARVATGERRLAMAGGVALNCVANSRLLRDGPFDEIWVQPAAGDSGTALGAAMYVAAENGDGVQPMQRAGLGRSWSDDEIGSYLREAGVPFKRSEDIGADVARLLADGNVVGWFDGPSEFGPRALGHRSLLIDPRDADNTERMNAIKGREEFRPVAPMVLEEQAHEVFEGGPLPSPYMLFTHSARPEWLDRIPAALHIDGSARVQTVGRDLPRMHRVLEEFERATGVPVIVNTSFNTAGRPIVDSPRDALETFGSSPIDALAIGSCLVSKQHLFAR